MIKDLDVLLGPEDQSIAAAFYLWPIPQGSQIGVCGLAVSTAEKAGLIFRRVQYMQLHIMINLRE